MVSDVPTLLELGVRKLKTKVKKVNISARDIPTNLMTSVIQTALKKTDVLNLLN